LEAFLSLNLCRFLLKKSDSEKTDILSENLSVRRSLLENAVQIIEFGKNIWGK
jgi:hypothetical protein